MAQILYTKFLPDDTVFTQQYPAEMFASKQKSSGFELHDPDNNYLNYVEVHGTGLKYRHGYLVGGTLTGAEYKTGDGDTYISITHADYKVTDKLDLSSFPALGPYLLEEAGNDTIKGSTNDDIIFSEGGKDKLRGGGGDDTLLATSSEHTKMSGGPGSDTFVFSSLSKIVIYGFDANGGGTDQDYIYYPNSDKLHPRIYQDGHNTVLDFGQHHTVTLLDVDRGDFSLADDFKQPQTLDF